MKALIAIIAAMTVGGVGGWSLHTQTTPTQPGHNQQNEQRANNVDFTTTDTPTAADFVSLRPAIATLPNQPLSDAELAGLLFMREEEKLARDVYTTLYEQWNMPIFANIAQSEQTHTEAVRDLLEKYTITDPVTDDTVGVFVNANLQQLYTDLTTRGLTSIEEALSVGALIEDLDINDLQQEIAKTDNQDIALVYENLSRGSRNHLRSFAKQLAAYNQTYVPTFISKSEYNAIIAGETERGGHTSDNNPRSNSERGWGTR